MIQTALEERKATFGGGCFWCTEALFQALEGVLRVQSGYSGGNVCNPTYREVCSGRTGHAEVVQVTYQPTTITYEQLIQVHMGTHQPALQTHDGTGRGTQYRSIVFYRNRSEQQVAERILEDVSRLLEKNVLTELREFEAFYPAEPEHRDYYVRNRGKPYCETAIQPKLAKLRQTFAQLLKH